MRESKIEAYLRASVISLGGFVRKLKWVCRRGAPDRFIALRGHIILVEVKRPGEVSDPHQTREHVRLWGAGIPVYTVDTMEAVDTLLASFALVDDNKRRWPFNWPKAQEPCVGTRIDRRA